MERTELDRQVEQLKKESVLEDSKSAFAAPAFLVKENTEPMAVDYRKLNKNMEPDRFPLPRADTIFETFRTATYFSSINIYQAFFQQLMSEDRGYTAYLTLPPVVYYYPSRNL